MNKPIMTIVIVDDEPTARYGLRSYVNKIPTLRCVGEFRDVMELENYLLKNNTPDIIFMDIQMPEMSGLDFIASRTIDSAFILVTAYEQYAIKGFELNVCDYLLKPVSYKRFLQAINKTTDYICFRKGLFKEDFLFLKADKMIHQICFNDIEYLESVENYVKVVTKAEKITIRSTLKELLASSSEKGIIQVHKSFAVNVGRIKTINGNHIITKEGHHIPLSRTYRDNLLNWIENSGKFL